MDAWWRLRLTMYLFIFDSVIECLYTVLMVHTQGLEYLDLRYK